MRKHNFGIFLVCTILFITFGVFNKHNSQTATVLSESDIKTVKMKTSEIKKEQKPLSAVSSQFKTVTPTPIPTHSYTQISSGNNSDNKSQGDTSGGNTNTNNSSITPTPTPSSEPKLKGGIAGLITIGPTCPVLRIGPDGNPEPGCEDRPYSTEIVVKSQDGSSEIARTTSGEDGYYSIIDLDPGTYLVIAGPNNDSPYPSKTSQTVTVNQETVQVSFSFDSGIR